MRVEACVVDQNDSPSGRDNNYDYNIRQYFFVLIVTTNQLNSRRIQRHYVKVEKLRIVFDSFIYIIRTYIDIHIPRAR